MLLPAPLGTTYLYPPISIGGQKSSCLRLSRNDGICCHYVTSGSLSMSYPPIEIGGYKYFVPNGTERKAAKNGINLIKKCFKGG
jgi:hypothetical protein